MPDPATRTLRPAAALRGTVDLPPDKSIGHRAAILSAVADGRSTLVNYPSAADPYTNPVPNWSNSRYMFVRLRPSQ